MSGQKAIEFTTQALTSAATEVKGVEHEIHKIQGASSSNAKGTTPNQLNGSAVFSNKDKN